MNAPALELRVLLGLQAGARLGLGDGRYVLGRADTVDVVLSGPRISDEHAVVTVASGRATIAPASGTLRHADGTAITGETDLVPGKAVDCDGVWIAVDTAGSAWPDPDEVLSARLASRESSAPSAAAAEGSPPAAPVPAPAAAPETAGKAQAPEAKRLLPEGTILPLAIAGGLLVLSLIWLWASSGADESAAPAAPAPVAAKASATAAHGAVIKSRLAGLGIGERVVAQHTGTAWSLVGIVPTEADRDRIRAAFADVRPAPVFRIYTEEEVSATVAGLIARAGLPTKFTLTGPGRGRLVVAAPNMEAAERVAQSFREELGGVREFETEFVTPAALAPSLQDMVNKAGLAGRVRVGPAGPHSPHLAAVGTLANPEVERWNDVVAEFTRRHGDFVKIQAAITRLTPSMPFRIRAVVDGNTPHVITEAGERIFEGGTLRGYRLVSIREQEIVFDGPERVSIARPRVVEPARAAGAR